MFASGSVRKQQLCIELLQQLQGREKEFAIFMSVEWENFQDALTTKEVAAIMYVTQGSVVGWIEDKQLNAILYRTGYLVAKQELIKYFVSMSSKRKCSNAEMRAGYIEKFLKNKQKVEI